MTSGKIIQSKIEKLSKKNEIFPFSLALELVVSGISAFLPMFLNLPIYFRGQKYFNIALVLQDE